MVNLINKILSAFGFKSCDSEKYHCFDYIKDNQSSIPETPGNYVFALKQGSKLPKVEIDYVTRRITIEGKDFEVVYTGVSKNLYSRIVKSHFGNNAGKSTLRKSLGSLMGFKKIPRDNVDNGKTKFDANDEAKITKWMRENLYVFYYENQKYSEDEQELINKYNPPLNLDKNHNEENSDYRVLLSRLRL